MSSTPSAPSSKTVLITGGAGFIGSHVAEAVLRRGGRVAILDSFTPFYPRDIKERHVAPALAAGAALFEADITDPHAVAAAFGEARPEAVIHLAAWAGVRPSIANPVLYAHVNVVGTQILLDAAIRHGVERFVVASSSSVYGNNEKVPFAEDDDVSRPISPYAATKVATELACRTASHLHGLPVTALRFFTVFGPRQRPDLAISTFLSRVAAGEPIRFFGDGTTSRDYTYIDDIVDGVLRALDRCGSVERYRCYNLGGEHPVSLGDLVAAIERTVGRGAILQRLPEQLGDVKRTWADLTWSKVELGYAPKVRLEEGLERQWEWMRGGG